MHGPSVIGCSPCFGWYTRRVAARGGDPLVTPSLFTKRAFTGGLLAGLAFFSGMIGFSLVFSLYLQIGLGYSPLKTGLASAPQAIGMIIGFVVASAGLSAKLGRRLLHLGLAVMVAGIAIVRRDPARGRQRRRVARGTSPRRWPSSASAWAS